MDPNYRMTVFPSSQECGMRDNPAGSSTIVNRNTIFPAAHSVDEPDQVPLKKRRINNQPPRLPLSILPSIIDDSEKTGRGTWPVYASPWTTYQRLFETDEAGPAVIATCRKFTSVVAIKSLCNPRKVDHIDRILHTNVVALLEIYEHEENVYLIYESIPITLQMILDCPYGPMSEPEIATICSGVLSGLVYATTELGLGAPSVAVENLLVNEHGVVKIANIGNYLTKFDASDIHGGTIYHLVLCLLQPGNMLQPNRPWEHPERWSEQVRSFVQHSQDQPINKLKADPFIEHAPGATCLIPYVEAAKRCHW